MNKTAGSVLSFVNRDAEEVADFFAQRYAQFHIEPHRSDGLVDMRGAYGRLPGIDFNTTEFKIGFDILPQKKEPSFFFMFPSAGAIDVGLGRTHLEANANVATASYGEMIESIRFCSGLRNSTISVEGDLVVERLSMLLDRKPAFPVMFEPLVDRGRGKIPSLESAILFLSKSTFGTMLSDTPIASRQMSNAIVDLVLEVWPHNFSEFLGRPYAIAAPGHVKRAIEYMNDYQAQDVKVEELAKLCGVSLRALQYGFRQFVGMTIGQYYRQVRLEGSRRSMMSDPSLPIRDVARLWHFSNPHRFSSEFEQAFGVTPNQFRQGLRR